MAIVTLSNEEIRFLEDKYSKLNYDKDKNTIYGILSFDLKYGQNGETIIDEFQIEINLNLVSDSGIPVVRETNNRIVNIAKAKLISPADLHLNNLNGEMCIIIPPKVKERYPEGFDLKILLMHLEEHLYWVSYFEKYNKAPWKEFGHGELGYLELYVENSALYSEDFKKYFNCNSRPEFRRKIKELKKKYKI